MPHLLDNVALWNVFRKLLDLFFGMYRNSQAIMRQFGIGPSFSILDIGCGTGQYSQFTTADYLGLDLDCRYIAFAQRKFGTDRKRFLCQDLATVDFTGRTFDVVLLVNLLHHVDDAGVRQMLEILSRVTTKYLVAFDPVMQSRGNYLGRFLTTHDRGRHIRSVAAEQQLIDEFFTIERTVPVKIFFTEGVAFFARARPAAPAR